MLIVPKIIQQKQSIPIPAMRRLMRELKELRTSPPEGIRVQLSEESMLDLVGIIAGPGELSEMRPFDRHPVLTRFCRGYPIPRGLLSREI